MALTLTHLGVVSSTADTASYTFSAATIGAAATDRVIFCAVHWGGNTATLLSASIGGIAATIHCQTIAAASRLSAVISAPVPTGTTGDIVITLTSTVLRCYVGIYRTTGLGIVQDAQTNNTAISNHFDVNLNTTVDGGIISCITGTFSAGGVVGWTGVTEDYDTSLEAGTFDVSAGFSTSIITGTTAVQAQADAPDGALSAVSLTALDASATPMRGLALSNFGYRSVMVAT